jgi:hypothetical protein
VVINHTKFHEDISFTSKVIQQFVFQRHISKPKLGHLMVTVTIRRPIFAFLQVKHKTVDNFGTIRDILMKIFVVDHPITMVWNDD